MTFVDEIFSSIAPSYDRMNTIMSLGWQTFWKAYFVERIPFYTLPDPFVYVDVACGTGDIGALVLKNGFQTEAFFVDPNPDMLIQGQKKYPHIAAQWIQGHGGELPFDSQSVDLYTIAFGLRNIQDRQGALKEAHRILKPGSWFFMLEFSRPTKPLLTLGWRAYLEILPLMGLCMAKTAKPYRYLRDSILAFPGQKEICMALHDAGFLGVGHEGLSGGIVTIYWGTL